MMMGVKGFMPWWAKIGAKIILSRIPAHYALWQKIGLFRHGYMDTVDYPLGVFSSHVERADLVGKLSGKTILELGPGDSVATALIAKAHGARSVLVDSGRYAVSDLSAYERLAESLIDHGFESHPIDGVDSFDQLLDICEARYLTEGLGSLRILADQSIDFVFSQAVLEHVRSHEFLDTQRQIARILKPDGVCSHRVDLRDHLGGALNNLRFNERLWESDFFTRSGFYTNRIQMKRMLELFEIAGFTIEIVEIRRWESVPTPRNKMSPVFAELPEDELNISGFDVLLRKP